MHMRDIKWAEERGMIRESERQIERVRDKLLASVNDLAAAKQKNTIYS